MTRPHYIGQAKAQLRVPVVGVLHGAVCLWHPILVLTIAEYEFCMQAWLKDSLIDMMIDIQETLIERIQKLN